MKLVWSEGGVAIWQRKLHGTRTYFAVTPGVMPQAFPRKDTAMAFASRALAVGWDEAVRTRPNPIPTGAWIALGLVGAAVVGAGIYYATRSSTSAAQPLVSGSASLNLPTPQAPPGLVQPGTSAFTLR